MNRNRIMVVVGIALLLALLAGVGAYKFLSGQSRVAEQARLQTVGIVVAQVDIPLGSTINPNQVAVSPWPKESYPKDAIADPKVVAGRVALRDFLRGEPVVESKLVPLGKSTGLLSLKVPSGMRAFSIKVNEAVGVGGFIVPDSRVDVVVTTPITPNSQEKVSKIVLQDIRVLAAGQVIEQKENKPVTVNTVTLALLPEEAEKLALAGNDGIIQLVMRNFTDNVLVMTGGSNKGRLLSSYRNLPLAPDTASAKETKPRRVSRKAPSPASAPPPKKAYTVEVIKGNKRTEEKVD
ncbi:Flp pilus assembly protein CpaB [Candidatus Deferrimicrobium sp.]|uniref:Flp pilus assembly protein CpaB n=1 Tax=Candidatus Deferrimicrobium sp. TaxID=3060586 RepID=UPI002ED85388